MQWVYPSPVMVALLILHHPDDRYFGEELQRSIADSTPDLETEVLEAPLEDPHALTVCAANVPQHERSILMYGPGLGQYLYGGAAADSHLSPPVATFLAALNNLSVANIGVQPLETEGLPAWWAPLLQSPVIETPMGAGPLEESEPTNLFPIESATTSVPTGHVPRRGSEGSPQAPQPSFGVQGGTRSGGGAALPPLLYVSHPNAITPGSSTPLLAYIYALLYFGEVQRDRAERLGDARISDFGQAQAMPSEAIAVGSRITVVPRIDECSVEPGMLTVKWEGEWTCAPFAVKPLTGLVAGHEPMDLTGDVTFYVGPIVVGTVEFSLRYSPDAATTITPTDAKVAPYQKMFASYSHRDMDLVEQFERVLSASGTEYLRDKVVLRTGEEWNQRLLELIDEADVFQLFWSQSASASKYVTQEWEHALSLGRRQFVRPVYWKEPLPDVPPQLGHLHFAFLDLE